MSWAGSTGSTTPTHRSPMSAPPSGCSPRALTRSLRDLSRQWTPRRCSANRTDCAAGRRPRVVAAPRSCPKQLSLEDRLALRVDAIDDRVRHLAQELHPRALDTGVV